MSTEVLCPSCGGMILGSESEMAEGRRCTCVDTPFIPDTEQDTSASTHVDMSPPGGSKICCMCGTNVAGKKRMKDSQGKYWCISCGQADKKSKGETKAHAGSGVVCPDCLLSYPPTKLIKKDTKYLCPVCYDVRVRRERAKKDSFFSRLRASSAGSDPGKTKKMLVILVIMAVIAFLRFKGVF